MILAEPVGTAVARAAPAFGDAWHDFFIVAGTAAATLTALLFVAIALHVETLVHDAREHLLALARAILFSLVMVLILSMMMLVPGMPTRILSLQLILLGLVPLGVTLRQLRGQAATDHEHFSLRLFRRRLLLPLIGYVWVALTGVAMRVWAADFFYWLVGAVCMLLGNAAGASWDLLVRVARIKRSDARRVQEKADIG